MKQHTSTERAGWRVREWCGSLGIGVTTFYELKKNGRGPRTTKLNSSTIVTESPADFLQRQSSDEAAA